jgi:uncharacterized membrane protein
MSTLSTKTRRNITSVVSVFIELAVLSGFSLGISYNDPFTGLLVGTIFAVFPFIAFGVIYMYFKFFGSDDD